MRNKAVACYSCNTGRGSIDWLTYKTIKMGESEELASVMHAEARERLRGKPKKFEARHEREQDPP